MTILTTARMRLEPLNDSHFEALYDINRRPEVMRYITGKPDMPQDTRWMIERVQQRWAQFGFSWWGFMRCEDERLIGTGCIQHLGRDPAHPLETGWRLHPDVQGQGYASEAARAMVGWAFDALRAPEVVAVCHPENAASSRVMQRLGMVYRGIEPWYDMDCAVYGVTRAKWQLPPSPCARQ